MEAINIFMNNEQTYNMFDRKIFDIKYWEYVRPMISCEANMIYSNCSPMFAKNKLGIKKYFINILNINKYFLKKQPVDILMISHPRRIKCDDKYKNNYIDYYVDFLKKQYNILTIEEPSWSSLGVSMKAHDFPLYTENIYLTDIHELIYIFRRKFYKIFKRKKYNAIINEYNEIVKIIGAWYKTDKLNFKKEFVNSIIRIDNDRKYVKKILAKTSPKIVMLHYMPSTFKQLIINECNKQKITTVEIQHGTISKFDPMTNKAKDVSKLEIDTKYIFAFGENQINKDLLAIKNINNVINVGFPFLEEKLKTLKKREKKYILIISQSTIGKEMAEFTSKLADLLKNTDYKIVFKYHPSELSKDFKCLKKGNIIEIRNERSIYDIQNESLLQIGVYSTSLYEGFAMKIPSLLIKNIFGAADAIDIFKNINKGIYYIEFPEDVLEYINKKNITPLDKDIQKIWQMNSEKNVIEMVERIIGR